MLFIVFAYQKFLTEFSCSTCVTSFRDCSVFKMDNLSAVGIANRFERGTCVKLFYGCSVKRVQICFSMGILRAPAIPIRIIIVFCSVCLVLHRWHDETETESMLLVFRRYCFCIQLAMRLCSVWHLLVYKIYSRTIEHRQRHQ